MSSLNDSQKIDYIKNYFHQYYDIELNLDKARQNETINLTIPLEDLFKKGGDYLRILDKYPDTDIYKEKEVFCFDVIDGDTIWVKNVDKNGEVDNASRPYKVRLVSVDTPEQDEEGYEIAKKFLTQCCLNKFIYLNIDDARREDAYKRTLAVVIANNKNINEVLLKENLATVMENTPSEFVVSGWDNDSEDPTTFKEDDDSFFEFNQNVFNSDKDNIVFTSQNNFDVIYPYEFYKGVYYIKMNPYSQYIRMHILPKTYSCSDNVLLLKDDSKSLNKIYKEDSSETYDYLSFEDKDPINLYFFDEEERDRESIPDNYKTYREHNNHYGEHIFCFEYDISQITKTLSNLEICTGYRYNNTNPFFVSHYTGVKDERADKTEATSLVDANIDGLVSNYPTKSNIISQFLIDGTLPINPTSRERKALSSSINHLQIGKLFRKKIKYINDALYSEEEGKSMFCVWNTEDEV